MMSYSGLEMTDDDNNNEEDRLTLIKNLLLYLHQDMTQLCGSESVLLHYIVAPLSIKGKQYQLNTQLIYLGNLVNGEDAD